MKMLQFLGSRRPLEDCFRVTKKRMLKDRVSASEMVKV
jgi:hypothetical protein